MLRFPAITGVIKRRMLVNYQADPLIVQKLLPPGLTPKLHAGKAIVGICLIRLEHIRPKGLPKVLGISSENAAHRIAVTWNTQQQGSGEGVFIPRRDTNSWLNSLAGGRIFPGEHHHSKFEIEDTGKKINFQMKATDDETHIELIAEEVEGFPANSIFKSLAESSAYFEKGSLGYSVTRNPHYFDGVLLRVKRWQVAPLQVSKVESSYFADTQKFPPGSVEFDHALIMRDIDHEWHNDPGFNSDCC